MTLLANQLIEQLRIQNCKSATATFFNSCVSDLVNKVLADHPRIESSEEFLDIACESRMLESAYDELFEDFDSFADPMLREAICTTFKYQMHDLAMGQGVQEEVLLWMD